MRTYINTDILTYVRTYPYVPSYVAHSSTVSIYTKTHRQTDRQTDRQTHAYLETRHQARDLHHGHGNRKENRHDIAAIPRLPGLLIVNLLANQRRSVPQNKAVTREQQHPEYPRTYRRDNRVLILCVFDLGRILVEGF
jgi:hypothetical protein